MHGAEFVLGRLSVRVDQVVTLACCLWGHARAPQRSVVVLCSRSCVGYKVFNFSKGLQRITLGHACTPVLSCFNWLFSCCSASLAHVVLCYRVLFNNSGCSVTAAVV
jgi:hypothetical protein